MNNIKKQKKVKNKNKRVVSKSLVGILKSTPGHLAYSRAYKGEAARQHAAGEVVNKIAMALAGQAARALVSKA